MNHFSKCLRDAGEHTPLGHRSGTESPILVCFVKATAYFTLVTPYIPYIKETKYYLECMNSLVSVVGTGEHTLNPT